jgi:hypothetical protein
VNDLYRSERIPTEIPTLTLADDKLKIDITPQYGGKVYSVTDLPSGRSLVHSPAIHQPVKAARLNAQVDGGIEWNWSPGKLGHWVGTESDVFAAKLETSKGPMVRVYEYDRWNGTYFQVDMLVVNGTLFAHPRVTNPNAGELTGYWWTCVGMQLRSNTTECPTSKGSKGTRVITPASYNVADSLERRPWPHDTGFGGNTDNVTHDMSFLGSWITGNDNFVRIMQPERPHVTVIDKDIFGPAVGFYHGHPLNGTKFWVGGAGKGSKRWYNWKEAPASPNPPESHPDNGGGVAEGTGCFFEPQIGHGPTQATGFMFPAKSTVQWTEVFKPLTALGGEDDTRTLYGSDYTSATDRVARWVESSEGAPAAVVAEMDRFFEEAASLRVTRSNLVHTGQPFGALEEMLRKLERAQLGGDHTREDPAEHLLFTIAKEDKSTIEPWLDLLVSAAGLSSSAVGTFSNTTLLRQTPQSYQTGAQWERLLLASASAHGSTWLHDYHLGVIAAERLDFARAKLLLRKSTDKKPTAVAYRALAALLSEAGEQNERWEMYQKAWDAALAETSGPDVADGVTQRLQHALAGEIALYLATTSHVHDVEQAPSSASRWPELAKFLAHVSAAPGCMYRGLHCDNDMVAAAFLASEFKKQSHEGCENVHKTLDSWPMVTASMQGYMAARMPLVPVYFSCDTYTRTCHPPNFKVSGYWDICTVVMAEALAGHNLTYVEQVAAIEKSPIPYWLEPSSWSSSMPR